MREPILLTEHDCTPGSSYENVLFAEACDFILNECDLRESTSNANTKLTTFRGKFQEAESVNKNRRMYPRTVLETNVQRLVESINKKGLVGELDHPTDSILHFKDTSHVITKLWWENNTLMGEGQILNTPCGKLLKSLIDDGIRVGISSRGVGNGKVNESGVLVIGESYRLITFDAVADPSTYEAFQQKVRKNEVTTENNNFKIESSSININKALLVATMAGIIKSKTNDIKARLN